MTSRSSASFRPQSSITSFSLLCYRKEESDHLPVLGRMAMFLCCFVLMGISSAFPHVSTQLPWSSNKKQISINTSDYPAHTIDVPIDHYNACDTRKYQNRYWINANYYRDGGPVFYFDGGEQDAHPLVPYFLYEAAGPSSVMTLARCFNGLALIFEHRFYGGNDTGSYPFPIDNSGMAKGGYNAYKYLSTEQALQDPVYFAHHFQPPGLEKYWSLLDPVSTPWIWLGGSYPGIRGAQLRKRNPETFFATWASSAPTEAAVDMWTYFAQVERSMTRNCSTDYTHVTNYVDSILANGTTKSKNDLKIALYTAVHSGPGGKTPPYINYTEAEGLSSTDMAMYLLLPLSFYQYYGFEPSVQPFCDIMETFNQTHVQTYTNGRIAPVIASDSGIAITHNITTAWNAFLVGIAEIDYNSFLQTNAPIQNYYSWMWQSCSEYGYYPRGNPDNPQTIVSRFLSIEHFQRKCNSIFPTGLPPTPNVSQPNKYGGWHINPSNTMFSSGEYDPWLALSPASIEVGSPHRTTVEKIPPCNVAPTSDTIFGIVHKDMVHVSDMRALLNKSDVNHQNFSTVGFSSPISTDPFYKGVILFQTALEKWLPCFANGAYGEKIISQHNNEL